MNQQIKQRIEQINNGQVPTGYKETEFGIFPCDWVTDKTFGDLFSFNGGLGKSRENSRRMALYTCITGICTDLTLTLHR